MRNKESQKDRQTRKMNNKTKKQKRPKYCTECGRLLIREVGKVNSGFDLYNGKEIIKNVTSYRCPIYRASESERISDYGFGSEPYDSDMNWHKLNRHTDL